MNGFIFGDINTDDYGLVVGSGVIDFAPKRVYEEVQIDGRDGTLLIDTKRHENCVQSYEVVFYDGDLSKFISFRNALMSKSGYHRLTDTFNPDEYYMACVDSDFEPQPTNNRDMWRVPINFTRKPQRFLVSGETEISFITQTELCNENDNALLTNQDEEIIVDVSSASVITNPTNCDAKPLLIVKGNGTINIGSYTIEVSGLNTETLYIDCDIMDAYIMTNGAINPANDKIVLYGNEYPVLKAGQTGINYTVSSMSIKPRWWRL